MTEKKNVCRCPMCGSTKAHYDGKRSQNGTFMTCPNCGHEGLYDPYEVSRDWYVELEVADGVAIPAVLPPQSAAERAAADTSSRWIVMSHNSYSREDTVVAQCATEAEAKQLVAERQKNPDADHMWIVRAGS